MKAIFGPLLSLCSSGFVGWFWMGGEQVIQRLHFCRADAFIGNIDCGYRFLRPADWFL